MDKHTKINACNIASYVLITLALLMILLKGLLSALFAGLLVYSLIDLMTPLLKRRYTSAQARLYAVAMLSVTIITLLTLAIWGSIKFFRSDVGNLEALLKQLADIIDVSRDQLPLWLKEWLPVDADALREMITGWLRDHAVEAKTMGAEVGRTAVHVLLGMIIGSMVALHENTTDYPFPPFAAAMRERFVNLSEAFQNIVFAQVRISAINTIITAVFIFIALPLAGISLPLSKSLIAITFFAGLLPVVGNLISNSMLVIVGLSHSLNTAVGALVFMIVVHKLEYFLNARIIGSHINARAWELLTVMLVMESLFGLPGVVAAPVFYALLKKEMKDQGLI